jgi:hypothetical protein
MADKTDASTEAPAGTADDAERAALAEWGVYVALEAIDIGGVRAFNRGEAVPVSHVERGVVSPDQVAKRTTKAGQEATQ